jgi:hypothetical protein
MRALRGARPGHDERVTSLSAGDPASHQLAIVARELARVIDRLEDAAALARRLSGETDWRAKAATAFHDRADAWAGSVSGLQCLAETARYEAARAQDRAAFVESARAVAALVPAGTR